METTELRGCATDTFESSPQPTWTQDNSVLLDFLVIVGLIAWIRLLCWTSKRELEKKFGHLKKMDE